MSFNATLAKISPERDIVWVKHYYDYTKKGERFDFYNSYISFPEALWNLNCTVLFKETSIWFIFPEKKACKLRSSSIPPVSPDWLSKLGAVYSGNTLLRGIEAEKWEMKDPDDESHIMVYYSRADDNRIPLRSPNQIMTLEQLIFSMWK